MDKHRYMVTSTPHIRSSDGISGVMVDVLIALTPAAIMAAYYFGLPAISLIVISICSSILFELLYQYMMKKPITINDFSAVVTGALIAFNLPASAPFWLPMVGSFFAIVIVKQLFGGLGQNFVNPALAARAFLLASYPVQMTDWSVVPKVADAVSSVTPLALLKSGEIVNPQLADIIDLFVGNKGGCLGEVCAVALIIGGLYLIARKVISWKIPVFYIATVAILSYIFKREGAPLFDILSGGLMLGAFFMATDYSSSPVTPNGKIIYAIGCGIITMVIRQFSTGYTEGVSYAILLMNLASPLIERVTRPRVFGEVSKRA